MLINWKNRTENIELLLDGRRIHKFWLVGSLVSPPTQLQNGFTLDIEKTKGFISAVPKTKSFIQCATKTKAFILGSAKTKAFI